MSERDPRDLRTPEDIKNGWSFEAWWQYHQERTSAAAEKIDPHHPTGGSVRRERTGIGGLFLRDGLGASGRRGSGS